MLELLGHEVIVADPNYAPMYANGSRRDRFVSISAATGFGAQRNGPVRPPPIINPLKHLQFQPASAVRPRPRLTPSEAMERESGPRNGPAENRFVPLVAPASVRQFRPMTTLRWAL